MAKSCSVTVELGQLIDAAKHTGPKRAPAGAKGSIAKTTLLYGQGDHLMVDTPMIATGVQILEGEWIKKVECHPFVERQPSWPVATTTLAGGADRKTGMPVWRSVPPA